MTKGQEERLDKFIAQYVDDYTKLESMGFKDKDIKRMLGQLPYVKGFVLCPIWLYRVERLPKGHKWTDEAVMKFKHKQGHGRHSRVIYTNYFYAIGNDLYIKQTEGRHKAHLARIENYKELTAVEVTPYLGSDIVIVWRKLGLRQGHVEPVLKEIKM